MSSISHFGDPVLRQKARFLTADEIRHTSTRQLTVQLRKTLADGALGVGLAAPQIGRSIAVAVVHIQKTDVRPDDVEEFSLTIINPVIVSTYGRRKQLWEGCLSSGAAKNGLFAKVPRYKKIQLEYYDEAASKHVSVFEGLVAHVIQHEVDHLNGILFVDRVTDTQSYMMYDEYRKMKDRQKQ